MCAFRRGILTNKPKTITIIGGGASGTLTAVDLLRNAAGPLKIFLVEKRNACGKGVAYSTPDEAHLLNVPAGKMGAFPDDIGHFYKWLQKKGRDIDDHTFVPRRVFGQYLTELLETTKAAAAPGVELEVICDEAIDVENGVVTLASGRTIASDAVVLAFGNFLPPDPTAADNAYAGADKYFRDQWSSRVYTDIKTTDDILIIGTGLSMVDLIMHFNAVGQKGTIYALSTRGLLPTVHELGHTYPSFFEDLKGVSRITDLLTTVRSHIKKAESSGSNWRAVIDSLRPYTQQIWKDLPLAEKRYFMQHLSRHWNVARHRMPAEAAAVVERMRREKKLCILKGRIRHIEFDGEKFTTTYSFLGDEHSLTSDVLINCIGSESDLRRVGSPLLKNLFKRGYLQADDLGMGVKADADGRVVDIDGNSPQRIFTLGTALKGSLWESTAIPEIRAQANFLAEHLSNPIE